MTVKSLRKLLDKLPETATIELFQDDARFVASRGSVFISPDKKSLVFDLDKMEDTL